MDDSVHEAAPTGEQPLGRAGAEPSGWIDRLREELAGAGLDRRCVDVVVPIHGAAEETRACIESVLAARTVVGFKLILIDDASPGAEIDEMLREFVARDRRIVHLRHEQNLGFVAAANRGMSLHADRDVVLLNSDTVVSDHWLDRLVRCGYRKGRIGTVTPFSNNATICSFPRFDAANPLPPGWTTTRLDEVFATINEGERVELPTGVGFCMFLHRAMLSQVGLFNERRFGAGYGEENDLCLRAAKAGWSNVLCADLFVTHVGGASFGAEATPAQAAAMKTMRRLHSKYDLLIRRHMALDPAWPLRAAARLAMFRDDPRACVLFVTHILGGGTERHIRELAELLGDRMKVLILRQPNAQRVVLSLGCDDDDPLSLQMPEDAELLADLFRALNIAAVHYHHLMGIDRSLWDLGSRLGVPVDVSTHDYYVINANPTLTDRDGRYCGEAADRDARCAAAYAIPDEQTPEQWRESVGVLLRQARRVIAPTPFAAALVREAHPQANVIVAGYPDRERIERYPEPALPPLTPDEPLRILVLGALSREKGADLLEECAWLAGRRHHPLHFELLGYAYRKLHSSVVVHGRYDDAALLDLIARHRPHLIWFPAVWPETYAYTLSAALKAGVGIVAPNIGAFVDRLNGRPLTWIEPWDRPGREWVEFFLDLRRRMLENALLRRRASPTSDWQAFPSSFRYSRDYLIGAVADEETGPSPAARACAGEVPSAEGALAVIRRAAQASDEVRSTAPTPLTLPERMVVFLHHLRGTPVIRHLSPLVPMTIQRRLRRRLSPRPIEGLLDGAGAQR